MLPFLLFFLSTETLPLARASPSPLPLPLPLANHNNHHHNIRHSAVPPAPLNLQPWQIPHLITYTPSGRPATHPYAGLHVAIADPNAITLGRTDFGDAVFPPTAVNCSLWWLHHGGTGGGGGGGEDPRGRVNTCDQIASGRWTVRILNGTARGAGGGKGGGGGGGGDMATDFVLRFGLSEAVVLGSGGVAEWRFEGEAAFRVGENMRGVCGGSGFCLWSLRDEAAPVLVHQTLVERRCVVGECD